MPTYKASTPKGNAAGQALGLGARALTGARPVSRSKSGTSQTLPGGSAAMPADVVKRVNAKLQQQGKAPRKK